MNSINLVIDPYHISILFELIDKIILKNYRNLIETMFPVIKRKAK